MDITNLSPYVRVAKDSLIPANIHLRKRVIFDYELVYLKSGEIILTVEDKTYHCIPGDILFLQPRTTHSVKNLSGKPVHQPHVHFDLCHEENSPEVKVSFRPLPRIQPDEMHLFRPVLNIEGIGEPPAVLRLQDPRSFEHKLFALIREFNSQMPRFQRIKKAKELIQFSDMSIQQVSEQVGYSTVGSFSRAFKSIEKVPPTYYR